MLQPNAVCDHCQTPLRDRSTLQQRGDKTYCCVNCAGLASGATGQAESSCAHCGLPIVFIANRVERVGKVYCCLNCAEVETAEARA